jgi:indolepyruvate ferredoxin oxidoreductase beta subunit
LGSERVHNVVLLGALSTLLEVPPAVWLEVIEQRVPARTVDLNRQAFHRGRQAVTR